MVDAQCSILECNKKIQLQSIKNTEQEVKRFQQQIQQTEGLIQQTEEYLGLLRNHRTEILSSLTKAQNSLQTLTTHKLVLDDTQNLILQHLQEFRSQQKEEQESDQTTTLQEQQETNLEVIDISTEQIHPQQQQNAQISNIDNEPPVSEFQQLEQLLQSSNVCFNNNLANICQQNNDSVCQQRQDREQILTMRELLRGGSSSLLQGIGNVLLEMMLMDSVRGVDFQDEKSCCRVILPVLLGIGLL
eukprot:TRINITY_DN17163_c0_g1_i1.p2 TRINITY_DN17163_c0_g1~~TRINITY_DN17163_c0_g1_i1.p2  ORF type:complete len:276 (+),score=33.68 TRINITY_DN17163_c0_g1_i1:96-830(+)